MLTLQERFDNALKTIRKQGIIAKRNVMSCCRSCVDLDLADNVPVLWHFGGQGNRFVIAGDNAIYATADRWGNYADCESIFFNHDNLFDDSTNELNDAGKRVVKAFQDNGIEVVDIENLSNAKCLEIKLAGVAE